MWKAGDTVGGKGAVFTPSKKATHAVIFMHGLGDTCDGWASTLGGLTLDVPIRFILPTAKIKSVTLNGGMPMPAWSDIFGLDPSAKEDVAGFKESFARVKSIINQTIASGIPASNIVVGGFSQGGAVALHTAMRLTIPIGGYIALSTWLPFASSYPEKMAAPAKKAKILQVHGGSDFVVSFKWGKTTHALLSKLLTEHPRFEPISGMGHSSDPRELGMVTRFINSLFKPAAAASVASAPKSKFPIKGPESIMSKKDGKNTTVEPAQKSLRYGCDWKLADRICRRNRHYAEHCGYFESTPWAKEVADKGEVTYYDSVTGKPLFIAPKGRSFKEFLQESRNHGWPSFRDEEVVWENVRCLENGEAVSLAGTHLGHNIPDKKGNRYCINLVCVAGSPGVAAAKAKE